MSRAAGARVGFGEARDLAGCDCQNLCGQSVGPGHAPIGGYQSPFGHHGPAPLSGVPHGFGALGGFGAPMAPGVAPAMPLPAPDYNQGGGAVWVAPPPPPVPGGGNTASFFQRMFQLRRRADQQQQEKNQEGNRQQSVSVLKTRKLLLKIPIQPLHTGNGGNMCNCHCNADPWAGERDPWAALRAFNATVRATPPPIPMTLPPGGCAGDGSDWPGCAAPMNRGDLGPAAPGVPGLPKLPDVGPEDLPTLSPDPTGSPPYPAGGNAPPEPPPDAAPPPDEEAPPPADGGPPKECVGSKREPIVCPEAAAGWLKMKPQKEYTYYHNIDTKETTYDRTDSGMDKPDSDYATPRVLDFEKEQAAKAAKDAAKKVADAAKAAKRADAASP